MKKNILISILLLSIAPLIHAMKEDIQKKEHKDICFLGEFDKTADERSTSPSYTDISFIGRKKKKDTSLQMKSYFCSFKDSEHYDDTELNVYIKPPLFIQLCVAAFKCLEFPHDPIQELLQRFKEGKIIKKEECKKPYIVMTEKDACYRLMSYIQQYKEYPRNSMVNGKETYLEHVLFATAVDKIRTQQRYRELEQEEGNDDEVPTQRAFVGFRSGETIKETFFHSRLKDDKEHHEKIVKEFEQLLNK